VETQKDMSHQECINCKTAVNIIEFISCWTETIMVVEKKDSLKTYEVLSNLVG